MGLYDTLPVPYVLNIRGIVDVNRIASMNFHAIDKLTYKETDDQSNKQCWQQTTPQDIRCVYAPQHQLPYLA
jgi:hypothetical protein